MAKFCGGAEPALSNLSIGRHVVAPGKYRP
jgi:hypothetical protein